MFEAFTNGASLLMNWILSVHVCRASSLGIIAGSCDGLETAIGRVDVGGTELK